MAKSSKAVENNKIVESDKVVESNFAKLNSIARIILKAYYIKEGHINYGGLV
ncbi:MAG: hypothetical protein OXU76_00160 [Alphaproteobacteria bacterium]|nr:hypothetical protein [Alphaproteobacteria bacterium]